MLSHVDHVIARDGVDGHHRNGHVDGQVMVYRGRVARLVAHAGCDGHAAVGQGGQIGCRDVQCPGAVCPDGGGVVFAVQGDGDRLPRFSGAGAVNRQVSLRFGRIQNVVRREGADGNGRCGGVHAILTACRRAVTVHVSDAGLHAGVTIFQTSQVRRWHGRSPVAVCIHGGGVGLAAEGDGDGLVRFHVGSRAGEHQIRAFLSRVDHVVGRNRINADCHIRQIHGHIMADTYRVARGALACNGDGDMTCRQRADVGCRNRCAPGTVCRHGSGIRFAVHGHGQCGTRTQAVAGAGDDQVLAMLDAVNHIVARHGVHTQTRQVRVDNDITLAGSGVAHAVGHGCGYGQFAVAESRQHRFRHVHRPAQIVLHRCRVSVAADGHGHSVARFRVHHFAADDLTCRHFSRVHHVVTSDGVDDHARQNGLHVYRMAGAGTVTHTVCRRRADVVQGFAQRTNLIRWDGRGPMTVRVDRRTVSFTVQHDGDQRTGRQTSRGTADGQILRFFGVVNHIVTGNGVDGQNRRGQVHFHIVRAAVAVTRLIGQSRSDGVIPGGQRTDVRCRYAHAPVTRRVKRSGVGFVIDGHGDHITRRRASGRATDDQRLTVLGAVNHVITGNRVDAQLRHGNVDQHITLR